MAADLRLFLLGSPRIELDGMPIELRRSKAMALLVYLAVSGEPQRRDALATLLWPESDQRRARATLRREFSELNKLLGSESFTVERETISLATNTWLDVTGFRQSVADCAAESSTCLAALTKAADLYRGDFLTGFTLTGCPEFDDWQFFHAEGLRQKLAESLKKLIALHVESGAFEPAIPLARRWLALDDLHEPADQELMRLFAWRSQWAAAERQYERCRALLEAELGVLPSDETDALHESIRAHQLEPPTVIDEASTQADQDNLLPLLDMVTQETPRTNLPIQPTPFIGREDELAALARLVDSDDARLISIVAPGGMGKTRLSIACAEAQVEAGKFQDGVYFVSLAPLSSPEHIVPTIADAVGFQLETGAQIRLPLRQLLDYLQGRRLLLVLDNFEHLLVAAEIVSNILHAAPDVKVLATSRERLHLHEEQLFATQGLEFPEWETPEDAATYTAVRLFVQSAQRVRHDFDLVSGDLTYLTRICRLVEGMPLGIELAASWVDILSLADIATEIQRGFDFLETETRNVPERHRSIRAVFDYSWQRMNEAERRVFAQLSVFRGGFTRQAGLTVTGANVRSLSALNSKSYLQFDRKNDRYQIHELLRQYGTEKLKEHSSDESAVRSRHAAYYCNALQQREAALRGPTQLAVVGEIEVDIENIHRAWEWSVGQEAVDLIGQAFESLCRYYEWRGRYQEGASACQAAVSAIVNAGNQGMSARLLIWQADFSKLLGWEELSNQLLRESSAQLEDADSSSLELLRVRASLQLSLGFSARVAGDLPAARRSLEASLALYRTVGDRWGEATALSALCWVRRNIGGLESVEKRLRLCEESEALARESVRLFQEIGDQVGQVKAMVELIAPLFFQGRFDAARPICRTGIELSTAMNLKGAMVLVYTWLGMILLFQGRYDQASATAESANSLATEIGYPNEVAPGLRTIGLAALAEGRPEQAYGCLKQAVDIYRDIEDAHETANHLVFLSLVEYHLGEISAARRHIFQGLRIVVEVRSFTPMWLALLPSALLLVEQGAIELAVEVYALHQYFSIGKPYRFVEDTVGNHVRSASIVLSSGQVEATVALGRSRDLLSTAEELLAHFSEDGNDQA